MKLFGFKNPSVGFFFSPSQYKGLSEAISGYNNLYLPVFKALKKKSCCASYPEQLRTTASHACLILKTPNNKRVTVLMFITQDMLSYNAVFQCKRTPGKANVAMIYLFRDLLV